MKLSHQLKSGASRGRQLSDQFGAGSVDWDEKAKCLIPKDARERARITVANMLSKRPRMFYVNAISLTKPDLTTVITSKNKVYRVGEVGHGCRGGENR
jgi:hypothetical protein